MIHSVTRFFEILSLLVALVALASGVLLGSGVSVTARSVFVLLSVGAFLLASFSMICAGRWRIVRSPLWLVPLGILVIGVVQIAPGMVELLPIATSNAGDRTISTAGQSTLQYTLWLVGGVLFLFVVASQARTAGRVAGMTAALALVMGLSGGVGLVQTLTHRPQPFGIDLSGRLPMPDLVDEIFSLDSADGLLAYREHEAQQVGDTTLFLPTRVVHAYFGGFLSVDHWAVMVLVMLPMLQAMALYWTGFAGTGGWRTHSQTRLAGMLTLLGLSMLATAVWLADSIVVPVVAAGSTLAVLFWSGARQRKSALALGGIYLAVLFATAGARWAIDGAPAWRDRANRWLADNQSLGSILEERPALGIGLGATGEAWTLHRPAPASLPHEGSSLVSLAVEGGFALTILIGLAVLYVLVRAFWIYRDLDDDGRCTLAGAMGCLFALVLCSATGTGMDLPVVSAFGLFAFAVAMRSLALGYRDEEVLAP